MSYRISFLYFVILILSVSCSVSKKDKDQDFIRTANLLLSDQKCDEALEILAEVSSESAKNFFYIQTLSSAHACIAKFNELKFFSNDIPLLSSTSFMNSLTLFSTSNELTVESDEYLSLKKAIETISYSVDEDKSRHLDRVDFFGEVKANELSLQMIYQILPFLGKWLQFYGDVDAAGVKGAGSGANNCIFSYTDLASQALITGNPSGSCANPFNGHPKLNIAVEGAAVVEKRMCDFIVSLNLALDVLLNADLSGNDSIGDLSSTASAIEDLKDDAEALVPGISALFEFYNYEQCQTYAATNAGNFTNIERYFAAFVELSFL